MQTLAKALVDDSTFANRTSEAEFTALCTEQAKRDYPKDGADVAFAKFFSDSVNTVIRQAHAMINAHPDRAHSYLQTSPLHKASYPDVMPTAPTQVGGEGDVSEKAYTQLMRMAREAHAAGRYQTVEQAFAAVAVETENQKLLADSVLRSRARITSGYPG